MTHAHGSDAPSGSDPVDPAEAVVLGRHGADHRSEPATTAADEPRATATDDEPEDAAEALAAQIEQPAKVMRIGTMIKQLLEEVRAAPLDEAGRRRLAEIHASSIRELESGLSPDLREELARLTLPFTSDDGGGSADGTGGAPPSESELRIAQAQLVGWLEGLFHGIQTALFAQQMAARAQLEEMRRRALPPGVGGGPGGGPGQAVIVGPGGQILGAPGGAFGGGQPGGGQPGPGDDDRRGTGQYL